MAVEIRTFYTSEKVTEFIELETDSFIGIVNKTTVLKYPKTPNDRSALKTLDFEAQILRTIGSHWNIIDYKGSRKDNLFLEYAHCESIAHYLTEYISTFQQQFT